MGKARAVDEQEVDHNNHKIPISLSNPLKSIENKPDPPTNLGQSYPVPYARHKQAVRFLQRQRAIHILQQHDTGSTHLRVPHKLVVVILDINVFICCSFQGKERVENVRGVGGRVLVEKVPSSEDAGM